MIILPIVMHRHRNHDRGLLLAARCVRVLESDGERIEKAMARR